MYQDIIKTLQEHQNIALIAHYRPDGDAIGSTLALGLALQNMGKEVSMFNEDVLPARFSFLDGSKAIQQLPASLEFPMEITLVICLDCGAWKRLGDHAIQWLAPENCSATLLNIDHHGSNENYGHINHVESHQAATACIIYNLMCAMQAPITPAIAAALYLGINTDTGSFQYGSTTPDVMRAAAHLIECGADVQDINRRLYQETAWSTLKVNREVLNHMVVEDDGLISHYSISNETKKAMQLDLEDTKDLVDIVRVVAGVKASFIVEEIDGGRVRVSLRSKDPSVNVSRVAAQFGGGGHPMASGIRMRGRLEDCLALVLAALKEEISNTQEA